MKEIDPNTGKPYILCEECDQPTLPKGVQKLPNEYDHARGCPNITPQQRKALAKSLAHWGKRTEPMIEAIRASEQLTAKDFSTHVGRGRKAGAR